MEIKVGDYVRSYDFPHRRDCYAEGRVLSIGKELEGCPRYEIRVEARRFAGPLETEKRGDVIYPPLNGTPTLLGKVCDGVELIAREGVRIWKDYEEGEA